MCVPCNLHVLCWNAGTYCNLQPSVTYILRCCCVVLNTLRSVQVNIAVVGAGTGQVLTAKQDSLLKIDFVPPKVSHSKTCLSAMTLIAAQLLAAHNMQCPISQTKQQHNISGLSLFFVTSMLLVSDQLAGACAGKCSESFSRASSY